MPERLPDPLHWKTPRTVFVNSMSDVFHETFVNEHLDFLVDAGRVMESANWHTYQILTKRPQLMRELLCGPLAFLAEQEHVWFGTSVGHRAALDFVDDPRGCPVKTRFLSLEPLLEPLGKLNLEGIGWVIVGGESGPDPRPMRPEWVIDIRDQCIAAGVPFFFKQWGGTNKKAAGRVLDDRTWDEMPKRVFKPVMAPPDRFLLIQELERKYPAIASAPL